MGKPRGVRHFCLAICDWATADTICDNGGLPRLTSGKGFIPNNQYWFADERKQQTESFLLQHSSWLGTMTAAVIYGIHVFLTRANELNPPKLSTDRLLIMIFFYLCGLAWWTTAFFRHFQKSRN